MSLSCTDSGACYTDSSTSSSISVNESTDSCNSSISCINEENIINKDTFITPYEKYADSWFQTENKQNLPNYIKKLFSIVRKNLLCNVEQNSTKAILVPHASIKYSGLCAASAYYELINRTQPIKNIILLCTSHYDLSNSTFQIKSNNGGLNIMAPGFSKISTTKKGQYIEIDTTFIGKIKQLIKIDNTGGTFFQQEHAFFNQIPFLEVVAPNAKICPLLIGNLLTNSNGEKTDATKLKQSLLRLQMFIKYLKDKLAKSNTILICSSDLSHVNGDFDTKIYSHIFQNIRRLDNETLNFLYNIVDGNESRNSIIDTVLFMQNSATCGIMAIYLFGKLLNSLQNSFRRRSSGSSTDSGGSELSLKHNKGFGHTINKPYYSRISCYYSSITRDFIKILDIDKFDNKTLVPLYEIRGINKSSVSYIGLIYTSQPYIQINQTRKIANMLTQYEELALLGLAREQLFYHLMKTEQNISMPTSLIKPIYAQVFSLELGVFTTLRDNESKLRGCIGTLETGNDEYNIESNVKKYVIEAAINDTRFAPVSLPEFYKLDFNITVLNELAPITLNQYFTNKFQLGRDGILMKLGKKQGYFLPAIAVDLGLHASDKNKLLDELCKEKVAGCDIKTAFRKYSNTQLFYNEGLEFHF
jgi:uncharacterized protein (TIGR00296 family)/AmmeMemoRadiSam system protein B